MSSVCLTNHWPYKADLACKLLKSVKSVFRFLIRVNRKRGVLRFGTALFFLCSQKWIEDQETAGTVAQALFLKHINDFYVFFVRDEAATHGAQMRRLKLAVDDSAAMGL